MRSNPLPPRTALIVAAAMLLTACTSTAPGVTAPPSPSAVATSAPPPTPRPTPSPAHPIVGEWHADHVCADIVRLLTYVGLEESIAENVVGNGLIPGVEDPADLADPADPCAGAVPRDHAHFFTAAGDFGSLDWTRERVDGERYTVDADSVTIGRATFSYRIEGDQLFLEADVPDCNTTACGFDEQWMTMVALEGTPWVRKY